jgi:type VI secretion system protein ImpL
VLSFVGVAILAVLVGLFGPLVDFLEGWVGRLAIVVGLLLVWAAMNLLLPKYPSSSALSLPQ